MFGYSIQFYRIQYVAAACVEDSVMTLRFSSPTITAPATNQSLILTAKALQTL